MAFSAGRDIFGRHVQTSCENGEEFLKITDDYLEAYARYQEEAVLIQMVEPAMHDRLVSAVGDMLIALHEANKED